MIKIDFLCVEVNKSTISKINLTTPAEQRNRNWSRAKMNPNVKQQEIGNKRNHRGTQRLPERVDKVNFWTRGRTLREPFCWNLREQTHERVGWWTGTVERRRNMKQSDSVERRRSKEWVWRRGSRVQTLTKGFSKTLLSLTLLDYLLFSQFHDLFLFFSFFFY
jgi:hypothetical protein